MAWYPACKAFRIWPVLLVQDPSLRTQVSGPKSQDLKSQDQIWASSTSELPRAFQRRL